MKDCLGQGKHVLFSIFVYITMPVALQSSGQGSIIDGTCKPTRLSSDIRFEYDFRAGCGGFADGCLPDALDI